MLNRVRFQQCQRLRFQFVPTCSRELRKLRNQKRMMQKLINRINRLGKIWVLSGSIWIEWGPIGCRWGSIWGRIGFDWGRFGIEWGPIGGRRTRLSKLITVIKNDNRILWNFFNAKKNFKIHKSPEFFDRY